MEETIKNAPQSGIEIYVAPDNSIQLTDTPYYEDSRAEIDKYHQLSPSLVVFTGGNRQKSSTFAHK